MKRQYKYTILRNQMVIMSALRNIIPNDTIKGLLDDNIKPTAEMLQKIKTTDDYCIWDLSETAFCTFNSECGSELEVANNHAVTKYFSFCPYCGRKIKIK